MVNSQRNSQRDNSQRNSQRDNSQRNSQRDNSQRNSQRDNSQRNSQRDSGGGDDMTEEQLEASVFKVKDYLLNDMRNMRKVRKDDIVKDALDKSSKQFGVIMKRVGKILFEVHGLQLVKIPDVNDAFIIVNNHRSDFIKLSKELSTTRDIQENLILTIVLSGIFMNRGQMYENHVMTLLKKVGCFNPKFYGPSHQQNKNKIEDYVTKLVNNVFVKKMYLEAKSVERPEQLQDPPLPHDDKRNVTLLFWGFRSLIEVDVDQIVQFIEKNHDGNKPPAFPSVYYTQLKIKQDNLREKLLRH